MKSVLKNLLRKNIFFHKIFFDIKIFIFQIKYLFTKNKNYKFRIFILQSRYNHALNFFKNNLLKYNDYSFSEFCNYISLCLRLKIYEDDNKLNKIIFDFDKWSPVIYVFFLKNSKNKLFRKWLDQIFKNDQIFISILFEPEKYIKNEKYFLEDVLKSKITLSEIRVYFKEIISQMYFNDLQFNRLNHFYTLDHIIGDYLLNKNSKKNKRLAIINLDPWTQSIGHFYYIDSFIKGVLLGILDYDYIVFSKEPETVISNKYLFGLYKSFLNKKFTITKNEDYFVSEPNMESWRHKNKKFVMAHEISKQIQKIWYIKKKPPIPQITEKDIKAGDILIKNILGKRKWFCTLHVREPGFRLNDHLWLDSGRNASINNYKKSIKYIYKSGGYTVRLGQKKYQKIKFPGFFDYGSSSSKSDFLDIFLIYKGKFNIGTSSGLSFLPIIFGKYRNIFTNLNLLFFISIPGSIGIPKLVYSINNKKLTKINIYEKFDPPFLFYGNESFKNVGYKLVENDSEDIFLLTKEFLNNYEKNKWDNMLKKRKVFPLSSNNNIYTNNFMPLPKYFIKKYKKLLN